MLSASSGATRPPLAGLCSCSQAAQGQLWGAGSKTRLWHQGHPPANCFWNMTDVIFFCPQLSPVPIPAPGHITHTPRCPCVGAHPCNIPKGFGSSPNCVGTNTARAACLSQRDIPIPAFPVWLLPPSDITSSPACLGASETFRTPARQSCWCHLFLWDTEQCSASPVPTEQSSQHCRGAWHSPRPRLPLLVCRAPRLDKQVHEQFSSPPGLVPTGKPICS